MRLEPLDRSPSWLGRVMSFGMKRMLGRTILPARILYNRSPRLWNLAWALLRFQSSLEIPSSLALLLQTQVAMQNGCSFCRDIARAQAVREKLGIERFDALAEWQTREVFDDGERAALAYAEAMSEKRVTDAIFEELRKHWSERATVEITMTCATENYYNLVNLALEIPAEGLEDLAWKARPA